MSPKDQLAPLKAKTNTGWSRLQSPHKTAIVIAVLAVLWMVSGVFKSTDSSLDGAIKVAETVTTRVRVVTITGQQHTPLITVMGRIEADKAVNVRAQVLGRVQDVVAAKGDRVEAGDVIVHIDPEDRALRLAEAQARLKQQEIAYESARKLSKGGYSSKLNVAKAKADLEAARAQTTRMQRDFDNATVTAPFDGVIDTLPAQVGDYFDKAGGLVARVIDLSTVNAVGQVAERDIGRIALGKAAQVRLPDGRVLDGTVTYIAQASNALTRTFGVEVKVNVPDNSVPEGITAQISLPMDTVFSHKISPALLTLDDAGQVGVKTVDTDGKVQFHPVRIVSDARDGVWLSGLPVQNRVISVGQEFVREGQTVDVVEGDLSTMIPQLGSEN